MQMKRENVVNELIVSAEQNGLIQTLYSTFGNSVKVSIPFSKKTLDSSVDDIDFSVRSSNALKRTGLMQIGEVVEAIEDERLPKVRNLGKKSYVEIQTKLLVLGYSKLTEAEKKRFFYDVLDRNGYAV
jgi:DNA-directed RNA polymerase alpha subunit